MSSKIAVCHLNDRVAPRFDQCTELVLATVDDSGEVKEKKLFSIDKLQPGEIAALLNRQGVTTLICGGVKEEGQKDLKRYKIQLVDNVIGNVEDVLTLFIQGKLKSGNTAGLYP